MGFFFCNIYIYIRKKSEDKERGNLKKRKKKLTEYYVIDTILGALEISESIIAYCIIIITLRYDNTAC